ncbi:MAG: glycosyltransferase family 87 protein, partial [Pseudomonadota bacterium]
MKNDRTASMEGAGRSGPAALSCIVLSLAVLSLQDYFEKRSLNFTIAYIVLIAGALMFVFLTKQDGGAGEEDRDRAVPSRARTWPVTAVAAAWTLGCGALSLFTAAHSKLLVGGIVAAGALLTSCFLLMRRGSMAAAVLPAVAGYLLMFSSPVPYMTHGFYNQTDLLFRFGIPACFLVVLLPSVTSMRPAAALAVFLVAGTFLRALSVYQWEGCPRDMIVLIHQAALRFLDGYNPYRIHFCGHDLPLTYLPLLWLSYVPAVLAGLDPRVMSVIYAACCAVIIYRWKGKKEHAGVFMFLAVVWFFQAEVLWATVFAESAPFWLLACLFMWAVARGRKVEACLFFGLMLGVRHFALLFLPFALVWFMTRGGRDDADAAARRNISWKGLVYPAVSGVMATAVIAPAILANSRAFFFGTLHWLTSFGLVHRDWWDQELSLAPLFYAGHIEHMLLWIQIGLLASAFLVFLVLAWRRKFAPRFVGGTVWAFCSMAYIGFLLFNLIVWRHLHVMGFMLVMFALAVRINQGGPAVRQASALEAFFRRRLASAGVRTAALALIAVVNVFGASVLGWGLYSFFNKAGMEKDAMTIQKSLEPGDLVVDQIYFNAWPIMEGTPMKPMVMDRAIQYTVRLRSQFPPQFQRAVFVTSGNHFVLPDDAPDLSGYMKQISVQKVGKLNVSIYKNSLHGKIISRLSDNFSWVREVLLRKLDTGPAGGKQEIAAERMDGEFEFPDLDPSTSVAPRHLLILYTPRLCILSFPPLKAELVTRASFPRDGRVWLQTAMDDQSAYPGLEPVKVTSSTGGQVKAFVHPNDQGIYT